MERNTDFASTILRDVKRNANANGLDGPLLEGGFRNATRSSSDVFNYHLHLLLSGGFLVENKGMYQLTWAGHDLLEKLNE